MNKLVELAKSAVFLVFGIILLPVLAPFFIVYLVILLLANSAEMAFKIFIRLIFPPLLVMDLWRLLSD